MKPCPVCHKQTENSAYHPFCCKRCADIDLGRWFNGAYAIPVEDGQALPEEELLTGDPEE